MSPELLILLMIAFAALAISAAGAVGRVGGIALVMLTTVICATLAAAGAGRVAEAGWHNIQIYRLLQWLPVGLRSSFPVFRLALSMIAAAISAAVTGAIAQILPRAQRVVRGSQTRAAGSSLAGRETLRLAGVAIPRHLEPRNFLLSGAPGTGKTQAIMSILSTIRARGERALVVDAAGDLMGRFLAPEDTILNPLDSRSVDWSPWAELRHVAEAEEMARSIIPDGLTPHDRPWHEYAQSVIAGVLRRLLERRETINERLSYYLTAASVRELSDLVAGLPAARVVTGPEGMIGSTLGIIGTYSNAYSQYLSPGSGADAWSIRRWVETGNGWLWIPYSDSTATATAPLRRAWLDLFVRSVMDLPPNDALPEEQRQIWLISDELPSHGYQPRLLTAAARGRKYGLALVAGIQSTAQVRATYGHDDAQALFSCLGTWLILRVADAETADYMSRTIGDAEFTRTQVSQTEGGSIIAGNQNASTSKTEVREIRRVVLPSQIQSLPDRRGYLRLPGQADILCVSVPVVDVPRRVAPFITRPQIKPAAATTDIAPSPRPKDEISADEIF